MRELEELESLKASTPVQEESEGEEEEDQSSTPAFNPFAAVSSFLRGVRADDSSKEKNQSQKRRKRR